MAVGKYERELKGILSGDEEVIKDSTKTCTQKEIDGYRAIHDIPFLVVRAGGSLGIDLIALRGEISFPIEVKSSKENVLYFRNEGRLREQAEWMKEVCTDSNVLPLYAYRLKSQRGDKWRVYTMELDGMKRKHKVLQRKIPYMQRTVHGNLKMEWDKGMPLSQLLSYLKHLIK
ncbi:MAG: Holliday junction resolvase [Candidatus Saliniplasma sp.]